MLLTRTQISVLLGIILVLWATALIFYGEQLSLQLLLPFGFVTGALAFILVLFNKYMWRWAIFRHWLVKRPDINGTWKVSINSEFDNENQEEKLENRVSFAVIRQTYSSLSVKLLTDESSSKTLASSIVAEDDGCYEIYYVYLNVPDPEFRTKSPIHLGACNLKTSLPKPNSLEGTYWTDRGSTGKLMFLDRASELANSFAEAGSFFK